MRDYVSPNVRPKTHDGYRTIVEKQLVPKLGNVPLRDLQPVHLQRFYADLLRDGRLDGRPGGLSARTVLHHHRVLSEALSHAVKWGLVGRNVAQAVDPPRPEHTEMATLDSDDVRRLLEAAQGTPYHTMFHLALYTGLRRSEFLGLRWRDVDLDRGSLHDVHALHKLRDGRLMFMEPKSAKGRRKVSLSPIAVLTLKGHRERQEADWAEIRATLARDALVFAHLDGLPYLPDTVSHAFTKIATRAGLSGIQLHDLRHTHASLMLRQGVHSKVVQERLGHSTIAVTLDTYSHVTPGLQEAAALKFDEALSEPPVDTTQTVPLTNG